MITIHVKIVLSSCFHTTESSTECSSSELFFSPSNLIFHCFFYSSSRKCSLNNLNTCWDNNNGENDRLSEDKNDNSDKEKDEDKVDDKVVTWMITFLFQLTVIFSYLSWVLPFIVHHFNLSWLMCEGKDDEHGDNVYKWMRKKLKKKKVPVNNQNCQSILRTFFSINSFYMQTLTSYHNVIVAHPLEGNEKKLPGLFSLQTKWPELCPPYKMIETRTTTKVVDKQNRQHTESHQYKKRMEKEKENNKKLLFDYIRTFFFLILLLLFSRKKKKKTFN